MVAVGVVDRIVLEEEVRQKGRKMYSVSEQGVRTHARGELHQTSRMHSEDLK